MCSVAQTTSMTQATKEEILQKQEDEKVCNRETKKLDQLLSKNQQLIQSTDSEMKRAEKLQVRGGSISAALFEGLLVLVKTQNSFLRSLCKPNGTVWSSLEQHKICIEPFLIIKGRRTKLLLCTASMQFY